MVELRITREYRTSEQNARLFDFSASLFSFAPRYKRKSYVAPEAASERYAPFYEINSGHCGISE
jgi:hypothetical protein